MKAVRQIIDYLCREGVLGEEDLASLAGGGFVGWHEVFQEPENTQDETGASEAETGFLDEEHVDSIEFLPQRPARPKRGGKVVRKGPLLDEKGLLRRLRAAFGSWPQSLTGLVRLSQRLSPGGESPSWQEAAAIVRKAELDLLTREIERGLAQRDPAFDVLWAALAMEPYRTLLQEPGLHGPAVSGYRAILAAKDRAHLGRHIKLLRHAEVASVYNLRLAQRKALTAMEPIFVASRHLFDQSLPRAADPLAYWTFVLLHSARRGSRGDRPAAGPGEHHPARELPDDAVWLRAWEAATILDPKAVTPFLIELHENLRGRPQDVADALWTARFELDEADCGFVEAWAHGLTTADISHAVYDEPEIAQRLQDALGKMRQTVEGAGRLSIFADPEGPARFEAFLRSIFMLSRSRYDQTVASHFGYDWELFCPKAWDRPRWG
jgi:hypothetical protein